MAASRVDGSGGAWINGLPLVVTRVGASSGTAWLDGLPFTTTDAALILPTPIAYWALNEGTGGAGTTLVDATGNGHTATKVTAGSWISGKFGSGLQGSGATRSADFAEIFLNQTGHTVAAWINLGSAAGVVIGGNPSYYGFYLDATDVYYSCNTSNFVTVPHGTLNDGWHHLAVVRTGSTVQFYRDGVALGPAQTMTDPTESLTVRSIGGYPTDTFPFAGGMDEIRLYGSALSAAQVAALYALVPPGTPITGTGAETIGVPALVAAGSSTVPAYAGSGALALSGPAVAAGGTSTAPGVSATGAVVISAPAVVGAGSTGVSASGAVSIGAPAIAGAGSVVLVPAISGTGAVVVAVGAVAGVGGQEIPGQKTPCFRVMLLLTHYPATDGTTIFRWSQRPFADPGAWSEGRLLNIGEITRSCTDQDGNYELAQVTVDLADDDAVFRTLLDTAATQFFVGREATIELLSDAGRAAGFAWRTVFRGVVTGVQLGVGHRASLQISDLVGSKFSGFDLDRTIGVTLGAEHPNLPPDAVGKLYPIIVGEHSDKGAVDVNGAVAEKGMLPVIDVGDYRPDGSVPTLLPPPSNVWAGVHGTGGSGTYTYAISTGNAYGESVKSAPVTVSGAPTIRAGDDYVEIGWDPVPGATFYRVWGRGSINTWLDGMNNGNTYVDPETYYRDDKDNDIEKGGPDLSVGTAGDGSWGRLVVSLGVTDVHDIFASDLGGGVEGAEPKRVKLDPTLDGVEYLTAASAAWPHPNAFIELTNPTTGEVIRQTVIYLRGLRLKAHREGAVTVAINGCGMEAVGDGSGALVDDAFAAGQLFLNEHILKNAGTGYRGGVYGPLEAFSNGDPQVWTSAWAAAQALSAARLAGGYRAAWAVYEPITVREWVRRFCLTFDCRLAANHHGQIYPVLINDMADPGVGRSYREWVEGVDLLEQPLAHEEIENRITYAFDYDDDAQVFRLTNQTMQDAVSIAAHVPGGVVGNPNTRGVHQGAVQELFCTRDGPTAADTRSRRLTRNKRAPRYVTHQQDLRGVEDDLGAQVRLTHRDGIGAGGDQATPLCVLRHVVVPWGDLRTHLTGFDLGRLLITAWPALGDESTMEPNLGDETAAALPPTGAFELR